MSLTKLIPNLMVKDVSRTIEFYQAFLGFELDRTIPEIAPFEWASMKCGAVEISFQEESNLADDIPEMRRIEIGGSLTLRIQIEGVDALYDRVKDNAVIVQDIFTFYPDVREFTLRDCNGYFLVFVEERAATQ
jgi:uncharacterized glyoxalase superfamily protein PhnB